MRIRVEFDVTTFNNPNLDCVEDFCRGMFEGKMSVVATSGIIDYDEEKSNLSVKIIDE